MVAVEIERRVLDPMERPGCEEEGRARAVDFLTYLSRALAVGVQVLEREAQLAVDMPVGLALLLGDRFGGQCVGVVEPRAVQRVPAVFRFLTKSGLRPIAVIRRRDHPTQKRLFTG